MAESRQPHVRTTCPSPRIANETKLRLIPCHVVTFNPRFRSQTGFGLGLLLLSLSEIFVVTLLSRINIF